MTHSEFAAKIRSKHPGAYDDMSDEDLTSAIVKKFPQYADMLGPSMGEQIEPGVYGETNPPEQKFVENMNKVGAGFFLPKMAAGLGEAAINGGKAVVEGLKEPVAEGIDTIKGMLPNPSIKGLGYTPSSVATEAGQNLAEGAHEYATTAQPELGQLVAKAGQKAAGSAMVPSEGAEVGDMASLDPTAQSAVFNKPIAEGMANSTEQMRDLTNEQWKQAGSAIENTLKTLDNSGVPYDATPVLKQIEGMYIRDTAGKIMTTGVQGETNAAISDALESMKDYANGKPIQWSDANHIKSMLQDSANYAAKRFDESNEAYKTVASLIKEDIDNQATKVLGEKGGNIQDFQALRQAFGKLSSLRSALNPSVGKEMLQPSFGETIVSKVKSGLPWGIAAGLGASAVRRMF